MIKNFRDLDVWKIGHEFVVKIYKLTEKFPDSERYGIISQIQRAAVSITSNIAEGFSRYYFRDRIRFYYQSRGSASEVENLLLIAKDIGYLKIETLNELLKDTERIIAMLNGLIRKTSEMNENL